MIKKTTNSSTKKGDYCIILGALYCVRIAIEYKISPSLTTMDEIQFYIIMCDDKLFQ